MGGGRKERGSKSFYNWHGWRRGETKVWASPPTMGVFTPLLHLTLPGNHTRSCCECCSVIWLSYFLYSIYSRIVSFFKLNLLWFMFLGSFVATVSTHFCYSLIYIQPLLCCQIFLHLSTLERSITWSRSILNAKCRICRRKGDGEKMLLCDSCDRGHHMYCLRPAIKVQ